MSFSQHTWPPPCLLLALQIPFGNVSLHVYDGRDIVSNVLQGPVHSWEENEVKEMLWALKMHSSPAQLAAAKMGSAARQAAGQQPPRLPLFVDVGANVGWFALNAAAAGARVAAFEGVAYMSVLASGLVAATLNLGTMPSVGPFKATRSKLPASPVCTDICSAAGSMGMHVHVRTCVGDMASYCGVAEPFNHYSRISVQSSRRR